MLEVPKDWPQINAAEQKLCEIFGVNFIYQYEEREKRKVLFYQCGKQIFVKTYAHPAPVHEIVIEFWYHDMEKACEDGLKNGYNKAYRKKHWWWPFARPIMDDTPNTDVYLLTVVFPEAKFLKHAKEATPEIIKKARKLYLDCLALRYDEGFRSGVLCGVTDARFRRPNRYQNQPEVDT